MAPPKITEIIYILPKILMCIWIIIITVIIFLGISRQLSIYLPSLGITNITKIIIIEDQNNKKV